MSEEHRDVHRVTSSALARDDTRDWLKSRGHHAVVVDDAVLFSPAGAPVRMAMVGDTLVYENGEVTLQ